jgi:Bacterial Ig-like domain (group 2)
MSRGGVLRVVARVLPLAMVIGLFGVGQASSAGALPSLPSLPTVPATLVAIAITPPVANVAVGATEQFSATGTYSDLSTRDLTDSVTWSSSSTSTATISSTGIATGVATGAATITATDPSAVLSGTAALTVASIPALPATLVAIAITPPAADVAVGAGEQFTATGTYSDLSTQDLTNSVTWSSSVTGTATVSNTPGSQGLATGIATGATTITATDPDSLLSGAAALTVTPVGLPVSPAPSIPQLALTPSSGMRRAPVVAQGSGFTPGDAVTVMYMSGVKARKKASTVLCSTVAASNGAFSCHGAIPRRGRSGKPGVHTIEATATGATSTSKFTLVRK